MKFYQHVIPVSLVFSYFMSEFYFKSTNSKIKNSIFLQKITPAEAGLVVCQRHCILSTMVLILMTFDKVDWVTVGFFRACRPWQEYQAILPLESKKIPLNMSFKQPSILEMTLDMLEYFDSRSY